MARQMLEPTRHPPAPSGTQQTSSGQADRRSAQHDSRPGPKSAHHYRSGPACRLPTTGIAQLSWQPGQTHTIATAPCELYRALNASITLTPRYQHHQRGSLTNIEASDGRPAPLLVHATALAATAIEEGAQGSLSKIQHHVEISAVKAAG